jgi:hypothetical protein
MVKKTRIHLCIMVFCLILTAGCARSGPKPGPQENTAAAGTAPAVQETAAPTHTPQPTATPTPVSAPSQPVAQFSGLASLDSYQSTTRIYSAGPGPDTISETISEVQFDRAAEATSNRMTTKRSDEDNPSLETQEQEQVTIGLETCSLEDGYWEYNQMDPQEKEVLSIFSKLYDVVPVISNPVFAGAETKNGVPANHFTFEVESAGAESGSVVTVNEGEYWVAVDGQYLVAYSLHIEMRSGPESDADAEVSRVEIEYSLEKVNQPIDIQLPTECTG